MPVVPVSDATPRKQSVTKAGVEQKEARESNMQHQKRGINRTR